MSLHPVVCADSALAESQNLQVVELVFVGAAVGANGVKLNLIPAQSLAQHRVHLALGQGTFADAKPTEAAVEALIKRPNGNSLSATEENIKAGLKSFLDEIESITGANEAVVFAVGGLNVSDIVCAELIVSSGAVEQTLTLAQNTPAVRIPEPVKLVSGKLAKDAAGTVAADLDTDKVLLVGGQLNGSACTVAGCFVLPAAARLALSAANTVKLRLCVQN